MKKQKNINLTLCSIGAISILIPTTINLVACNNNENKNFVFTDKLANDLMNELTKLNEQNFDNIYKYKDAVAKKLNQKIFNGNLNSIDILNNNSPYLAYNQIKFNFNKDFNLELKNLSNSNFYLNNKQLIYKTNNLVNTKTIEPSFKRNWLINDMQYMFELINDMATNDCITIIMNRKASLPITQQFFIALMQRFIQIQNNIKPLSNPIIIQNSSLINSRFDKNSILNNLEGSVEYNLDAIQDIKDFTIINNTAESGGGVSFKYLTRVFEAIDKNPILKNKKIDFIFPELNLIENVTNNQISSLLAKRVNRIICLSDGAAQTYRGISGIYNKIYNSNNETYNRKNLIKKLITYQNNSNSESIFNINDFYDCLLLDKYEAKYGNVESPNTKFNFFNVFHYDASYAMNISLYEEKWLKKFSINTFSVDFDDYLKKLITDSELKKKAIKTFYSTLFLGEDIFISGKSNFDPNKKNAIYLGSNIFNNNLNSPEYELTRQELIDNYNYFLKKFPPKEYNIIFKPHPNLNNEFAINFFKIISNNTLTDPIVINPKIPFENLLSLDYHIYNNDPFYKEQFPEYKNFIFQSNSTTPAEKWTSYFGVQGTTTSVHTTRIFYQLKFNKPWNVIDNLITYDNFFIPKTFGLLGGHSNDPLKNFINENRNIYKDIFKWYMPSLYLNNKIENRDYFIINSTKTLPREPLPGEIKNGDFFVKDHIAIALTEEAMNKEVITIPNDVYEINANSFSNHNNVNIIKKIICPSTLQLIDNETFNGFEGLKSINLPDGVILGQSCFKNSGLEEITLPENVKFINKSENKPSEGQFLFCSQLKKVTFSKSMNLIPSWMFDSSGLESIIIPENINEFGKQAFENSHSLKLIEINTKKDILVKENAFGDLDVNCIVYVYSEANKQAILNSYSKNYNLPKIKPENIIVRKQ